MKTLLNINVKLNNLDVQLKYIKYQFFVSVIDMIQLKIFVIQREIDLWCYGHVFYKLTYIKQ